MLQTTRKNTDMLNAVANLTEMKLNLTRELNTNKGEISDPDSKHLYIYFHLFLFFINKYRNFSNNLINSDKIYHVLNNLYSMIDPRSDSCRGFTTKKST